MFSIADLNKLKLPEIQEIIKQNESVSPSEFVLINSSKKDLPLGAIAEQIECRKKASKKFPSFNPETLLYEKTTFEQSSGEPAAKYKASLFSGNRALDMTGGMGIDSIRLAKQFNEVHYCELNKVKTELFRHNVQQLGVSNVIINNTDSLEYISQFPPDFFNLLYLDPARRTEGKRSVDLKHLQPDLTIHYENLSKLCTNIMVKLSPAFDVTEAFRLFPDLKSFTTISVNGECKEALLLFSRDIAQQSQRSVLIKNADVTEFEMLKDSTFILPVNQPNSYIYLPDCSVIKSGLNQYIAEKFGLTNIGAYPYVLTSDKPHYDYPGRCLEVTNTLPYKAKQLKKYLKEQGISRINIISKGTGKLPAFYYKETGVKEGGNTFLLITPDDNNSVIALFCKRITDS